jgi:hypothetical protein
MPLTRIQSLGITDGTIVNADINASAAIAGTKISGSFGKVLQVITATDSTERGTTSTSFVTGSNTLSVSITPSSTSNKILVITNSTILADNRAYYTIYRGATNLGDSTYGFVEFYPGDSTNYIISSCSMHVLDSPSSTSSLTYQVYFRDASGSGTSYLNYRGIKGTITCLEIAG